MLGHILFIQVSWAEPQFKKMLGHDWAPELVHFDYKKKKAQSKSVGAYWKNPLSSLVLGKSRTQKNKK